jgi:hypothetical protein
MSASWPYPPHHRRLCEAFSYALKFDPGMFAGPEAALQ